MPKKESMHPGGKYLRELRDAKGMTQEQLSDAVRLSVKVISYFEHENPKRWPDVKELVKICEVLGVEPEQSLKLLTLYGFRLPRGEIIATESMQISAPMDDTMDLEVRETIREIAFSLQCAEPALLRAFRTARAISADTAQLVSQRRRIVEEGLEPKVLRKYYNAENLARGGLVQYTYTADGSPIVVPVASRPDWCGLQIPLDGDDEQCILTQAPYPNIRISEEIVGRVYASLKQQKVRIWNAPIYRLLDLAPNTKRLAATFGREEYYRHRFTINLIIDELKDALIRTDFDVDEVLAHRKEFLPLRQRFLPDGGAVLDFEHRVCAIGVMTLLAMAHPQKNEFVIPLKRRSWLVATKQGMVSVIPQGFHQPTQEYSGEHDPEIKPSFSVLRELYEELFRGEEVEQERKYMLADWFLNQRHKPMGWFRDHTDDYSFECTSCGFELASGDCTIGILFVIRNGQFLNDYSSLLAPNWEFKENVATDARRDVLANRAGGALISSRDRDGLVHLLQRSDWDPGGLVAFIEGLKRLKEMYPSHVNLPRIESLIA